MGFHWTRCNPVSSLVPILLLVILYVISTVKLEPIVRDLVHGAEWCCAILAAGMVISSVSWVLLEKLLMPNHVLFVRGEHKYIRMVSAAEARHEYETGYQRNEEIAPIYHSELPRRNNVQILPRNAYEWQEDGQLDVSKRRYKRQAR